MPSMFNRRFSSSPPLQSQGSRFVKSQLFTLMMVITALAACSDPGPQNPNQGSNNENTKTNIHEGPDTIQCERGVPSTDGKTCVNSDNCGGNTSACIEGFSCKGSACVAIECGEGKPPCTRGECSTDGLCVSKAVCRAGDAAKACIAGEVCIGTRCEPPKTCDAVGTCGVADAICLARRANCVEATTCTSSDQCQQGRYCHPTANTCEDDKCVTPSGLKDCAAEGGGVCNSATGVCENAVACTAASQCIDDIDLTKKQICSDNPGDSSATDKKCRTFNVVCEATCRDINRCQYDAANLTLTCGDGSCSTLDECGKSQYCDGSTCQEISKYACVNDSYEGSAGNEDKANATPIATGNTIPDLALCPTDVDVFVIDDVSAYLTAGKLFVADLQYKEASHGRKVDSKMTVEFVKVDDSTVPPTESVLETYALKSLRQDSTDPAETYHDDIVFNKRVDTITDLGKIYITVEHTDSSNVLGVDYSLKVEAVEQNIFDMCQTQTELTFTDTGSYLEASLPAQNLNGAASLAASFPSEPACNDLLGDIPELAYHFKVEGTKPKRVVIDAVPQATSDLDLTLVVLKGCTTGTIDVNPNGVSGCVETAGESSRETYRTLLEPGDYTVVATAKDKANVGTGLFDLTVQMHDITCDPEVDNVCSGASTVRCDNFLENSVTTPCPTDEACIKMGPGVVACTYDYGGKCDNPYLFSKDFPLTSFAIKTSEMKGQTRYSNSRFDCDGKISSLLVQKGEAYLKTTVPPDHTAIVTATPTASPQENFTIYTLKSCGATTCESITLRDGQVGVRELSYKNTGTTDEEIIFVIESETEDGEVTIDAKVEETTTYSDCVPGETKCDTTDPADQKVLVCKQNGSGDYEFEATSCGANIGCDSTLLPPACEFAGDTCDKAIVLKPNVTYSYKIDEFTDAINKPGDTCPEQDSVAMMNMPGSKEAVFRVDPPAGKIAYITVKPTFFDAIIWQINGDCSAVNTPNHCKIGVNKTNGPEALKILSDGNPIYFVVEGKSFVQTTSTFDIKVEYVEGDCRANLPKPTCDTSSNTVTFCDAEDIKRTEVCTHGCSDTPARCNPPATGPATGNEGTNCANPILLTGTSGEEEYTMVTGNIPGLKMSVNGMSLSSGLNGECSVEPETDTSKFGTTEGPDVIYAFNLTKDQVLEYKIKTKKTMASINNRFRVYILNDSCSPEGCRNMRDRHFVVDTTGEPDGDAFKYYSRATGADSETVYLVIDTTYMSAPSVKVTLNWEIKTNPNPGTTESLYGSHCDGSNSVWFIDREGTWSNAPCPTGTECKHGACLPVKTGTKIVGDVCDTTIKKVDLPAFFVLESSATSSAVDLTNNATPLCGGAELEPNGSDYFFKVDVPPGQTLSVRGMSAGFGVPIVYIAEDCAKLQSGAQDACYAGMEGAGSRYQASEDHALAEYHNSTGSPKSVTIGLDSRLINVVPGIKDAFYYIVDLITAPSCTNPGEITCDVDSSAQARLYRCLGGKREALPGGECVEENQCHTNMKECKADGDSPDQAVKLENVTSTTTLAANNDLHKRTNTSDRLVRTNPGKDSNVYGSCPFMRKPIGPDYYYYIDLDEGDYLEAKLEKGSGTTAGFQPGMLFYLLGPDKKTCITLSQAATHSVRLRDSKGTLPLTFQAFKQGRYYLVVDNMNKPELVKATDSSFSITYSVQKKGMNDCVKYATQCKGGGTNDLYICDEGGHAPKTVDCPYGCIGRACRTESPAGTGSYDVCSASDTAIEEARLFIYDDESPKMNKEFNFSRDQSCGTYSYNTQARSDLFIKVKLKDKEYLKISDYRSNFAFRTVYSIMEPGICTSGMYTCEAAESANASFSDDSNLFRSVDLDGYIANGDKDVYLGLTITGKTSISSNAALVYVEFKQGACSPAASTCTVSGGTASVSYCSATDQPAATYTCGSNACNGNVCEAEATNAGDSPFAPIDLVSKAAWTTDNSTNVRTGIFNGTTDGRNNSYGHSTSYFGGCDEFNVKITPGRDVFHRVVLQPGETLEVDLERTNGLANHNVYLYRLGVLNLTPTKPNKPFPSCLAGKDSHTDVESISYTYPKGYADPAEFLIVADSRNGVGRPNDSYDYKMTVKITPPTP